MKKSFLALVLSFWASAAFAEGPINALPYGRGPGTGFSYAAAAANSILATNGSNVPGLTQTLPTAVQDNITRVGTLTTGAIPSSLLTGTIDCARLPALTGDLTTIVNTCGTTLATVNSNVGSFGSATQCTTFTVNAKGLITAASATTCTPTASSVTGGQALSRVDDTNVTLTLGGTPGSALLQSVSLTLGWSGTLGVSRGGLGGSTTATSGRYLKGDGVRWNTSNGDASGTGSCTAGQFVTGLNSDAAPTCAVPAGGGDVTAASSFGTDNRIIRSDGTGKGVQVSGVTVDDSVNMSGIADLAAATVSGSMVASNSEARTGTSTTKVLNPAAHVASHKPAFKASGTSKTLTTNTWTLINTMTESMDSDGNFASSRFTPTVSGYYMICISGNWATQGGESGFGIYFNGSLTNYAQKHQGGGTATLYGSVCGIFSFNGSTDYVEMYGLSDYASSGGSMNSSEFFGFRLFP